ncbi:hypothetical protein WR25_07118 [Diploscapter pachys]|uniref:N-terminal methionine N(alpha)-acetyltransferase NatE n=1 Tax=Diploscapter pachys TaxID=2018661 RepID=A0A2A2JFF6_9BILA|nr:hypothetical protein WR25_07118 [Diploscapter pachys]
MAAEIAQRVDDLTLSDSGASTSNQKRKNVAGRYDIQLGDITHHNVLQLRRLNQAVFPVTYNDKFYTEVISAGELAKYAYFNDVVVGAVCCRADAYNGKKGMYIMTLGTLAPYRQFGVGDMLLKHVFALCRKDPAYEYIFLHVQVNNETALQFYKRYGFTEQGVVEKYYKRIEPDDAYILVKNLKEKQFL